jgi:hypothetical protein
MWRLLVTLSRDLDNDKATLREVGIVLGITPLLEYNDDTQEPVYSKKSRMGRRGRAGFMLCSITALRQMF